MAQLPTNLTGLILRPLEPSMADELYDLVQANRHHLTRHGDYTDLVERGRDRTRRELAAGDEHTLTWTLWYRGELIGTVSLVRYEEGVYGLGYWIAEAHAGRGYMTEAVRAMVELAHEQGASQLWAGITHTNQPSIRLVTRLGFRLVREQPTHKSFRLDLVAD